MLNYIIFRKEDLYVQKNYIFDIGNLDEATITITILAEGNTEETETFQLVDNMFKTTVVNQNNDDGMSTYSLNNDDTVSVNLVLSEEFQEIGSFNITDVDGQSLTYQISNNKDSILVENVEIGKLYVFTSEVDDKSIRGAVETCNEGDSIGAVTDIYDFSELKSAATNSNVSVRSSGSSTLQYEISDTTVSDAKRLTNGTIMRGQLHSAGDYDYYLFTADRNGTIDFKLLIPENYGITTYETYYNIRIYKKVSDYYTYVAAGLNSSTVDEYCRISGVSEGETYRIEIYPTSSGSDISYYYLQVENKEERVWYPQAMGKISSTYYWNTNKLDLLYYNNSNNKEIYFTDNKTYGDDLMAEGCTMASLAMIFFNCNAENFAIYDFRLLDDQKEYPYIQSYTANVPPDPYTIFLANNNSSGNDIYYNGGKYELPRDSYTVSGQWNTVASAYGLTARQYFFDGTLDGLTSKLNTLPDSEVAHGVLLRFPNHSIVITRGEDNNYYVYDPGCIVIQYKGTLLSTYFETNYIGVEGRTSAKYSIENALWFRSFS